MKFLVAALFLFISTNTLFAQEEVEIIEITEDKVPENIPFAIIEKVPVYPGCTGDDNGALKQCMSEKISAFVNQNFNIKKVTKGLSSGDYKVFVIFKIGKDGQVTGIRTRGPNRAIEEEAKRVMKKIPKMIPGQQKGKKVGVLYTLPISFKIDKKDSKKKTKG